MLSKFCAIIIILLFSLLELYSNDEVFNDTIYGMIGNEITIPYNIENNLYSDKYNQLTCNIIISNPTLFIPNNISIENTNGIIEKINDTTYSASIKFESSNSRELLIRGKIYAGNDTTTSIILEQIETNGIKQSNYSILLKIQSLGSNLPYIKIARIINIYPMPIQSSAEIHFGIDTPSDTKLYLTSLEGKTILINDFGILPKGKHKYKVNFNGYPIGLYYFTLRTASGVDNRKIIFIGK